MLLSAFAFFSHVVSLPSFTGQVASIHAPADSLPAEENEDHSAFDVTFISATAPPSISAMPTTLSAKSTVTRLFDLVDSGKTLAWLTRLTQFPERYYKSDNGVLSAEWIRDQVLALNSQVDPAVNLTVSLYKHPRWKQPSVIARLEAMNLNSKQDLVITGSHFDTLARDHPNGEGGANPAADDCASGSAVVFEALRVLVKARLVPVRPMEFHFYAAEEKGLLGSKEISSFYAKSKVPVFAYLNLDQSGYIKPGTKPSIGLVTDYTSADATAFLKKTVQAYTTIGTFVETKCGYACTDHAPWFQNGYKTAFIAESRFEDSSPFSDRTNKDGSPLDTLEIIDINHVIEFVRNTLGFLVELSLA